MHSNSTSISEMLAPLKFPVLAIDLGSAHMRALLYVPEIPAHEQYGFMLPSPERLLTERIRANTGLGRAVHIWGKGLGGMAAEALATHLKSRSGLSMHPDSAALLSDSATDVGTMGVVVSKTAPPLSVSIRADDFEPEYWRALFAMTGLPQPKAVLVTAIESGKLWNPPSMVQRSGFINEIFNNAGPDGFAPPGLMLSKPPARQLRLAAIARITGCPVADSSAAFIMGLSMLPEITARSQRQGVMLLHMGTNFVCAALYFRGKVLAWMELPYEEALLEVHGKKVNMAVVQSLLDDFRLGWLPQEKAVSMGGFAYKTTELPAEAEGFKPAYVTGHRALLLKGAARILSAPYGSVMHRCWGLLYGYADTIGTRHN